MVNKNRKFVLGKFVKICRELDLSLSSTSKANVKLKTTFSECSGDR